MDNVIIYGFVFNLFLFLILIGLVSYAVYVSKKVKANLGDNTNWFFALSGQKIHIIVLFVLTVSFVSYLSVQTAYRPKNTISKTNVELKQKLKEIDNSELPQIKEAEGDIADKINSNYSEKNTEENKKAVEAFRDI